MPRSQPSARAYGARKRPKTGHSGASGSRGRDARPILEPPSVRWSAVGNATDAVAASLELKFAGTEVDGCLPTNVRTR